MEELRRLGHDVVTTAEAGQAGLAVSDAEVLAQATAQGRAVLTFNRRHFIRLHAEASLHAGIIVCIFDVDFAALASRIEATIRAASALEGQLLRVKRAA